LALGVSKRWSVALRVGIQAHAECIVADPSPTPFNVRGVRC